MKIYIPGFNNTNLLKKMEKIKRVFLNDEEKEKYIIYSEEGIYEIESNIIYKLDMINDSTSKQSFLTNNNKIMEFLIDNSEIKRIPINYIPFCHNMMKNITFTFLINNNYKKNQIKLNIVSICHNLTNSSDSYFYFEMPDNTDLNNSLIKEDINVFLSHLN